MYFNPRRLACTALLLTTLLLSTVGESRGATILPVGPITFDTDSDFDSNFKEPPFPFNGLERNAAGYLSLVDRQAGLAVFDQSATGGAGGSGGTNGSDSNNDLSDFVISADFASSVPFIGGGFLLRLDSFEAVGYLAVVHSPSPNLVVFELLAGSSLFDPGFPIFSQTVSLPDDMSIVADTFYSFQVTADSGAFHFDFANGAATASFVDPIPATTAGQVGILVLTPVPGVTSRLDNFQISAVPEPSSLILLWMAAVVGSARLLWQCTSR